MATIKYIDHAGTETVLSVSAGTTVMHAAVDGGVAGIVGECGGSAMCATCHVYVDEDNIGNFDAPGAPEREMLECTAAPLRDTSRLGCQLVVKEGDMITVRIPETQQ